MSPGAHEHDFFFFLRKVCTDVIELDSWVNHLASTRWTLNPMTDDFVKGKQRKQYMAISHRTSELRGSMRAPPNGLGEALVVFWKFWKTTFVVLGYSLALLTFRFLCVSAHAKGLHHHLRDCAPLGFTK